MENYHNGVIHCLGDILGLYTRVGVHLRSQTCALLEGSESRALKTDSGSLRS